MGELISLLKGETLLKILRQSKDHVYTQIANLIFIISGFFIHIILTRYIISIEDYGVFNVLINILTTISLLVTTGIPLYVTKKISRKEADTPFIIALSLFDLLIAGVIGIILVIFANPVEAFFFDNIAISQYLSLFIIVMPAYVFTSIIQGYYGGKKQFLRQAFVNSFTTIAKAIVVIIAAFYLGILGAFVAYATQGYLMILYFLITKRKNFHISINSVFQEFFNILKKSELWQTIIPITLYAFLNNFLLTRDILFVENYLPQELGVYSAILVLTRTPIFPLLTLGTVLFPLYSEKVKNTVSFKKRFLRDIFIEAVLSLIMVILLVIFGNFIVEKLFDILFFQMSYVIGFTALSSVSFGIFSLLGSKAQALGYQKESVFVVISALIILVLVAPATTLQFGLMGASINIFLVTMPISVLFIIYLLTRRDFGTK